MKVYKIRHKPTDLFYRPIRGDQSNLHKNGKLYHNKPTLKLLRHGFHDCFGLFHQKIIQDEWEIVIYTLVEQNIIDDLEKALDHAQKIALHRKRKIRELRDRIEELDSYYKD